MSDNWLFDVLAEGDDALAHAIQLAWPTAPGGTATHYEVIEHAGRCDGWSPQTPRPTLILLWSTEGKAAPLPFALNAKSALAFVQGWLADVKYPTEPDHDGDNGRGWRVFNEEWGYVAGRRYAVLAVQPAWMLYGK